MEHPEWQIRTRQGVIFWSFEVWTWVDDDDGVGMRWRPGPFARHSSLFGWKGTAFTEFHARKRGQAFINRTNKERYRQAAIWGSTQFVEIP